jgi:ABC-type nitrate/sulfonate/bicarbonate transport system substrate-binding protein
VALQKISFPYRAVTHLNLLHVIAESGAWEKYGLDVKYDFQVAKGDAHRLVGSGEVEFVSGNHLSSYAKRTEGDKWVYLGQTLNCVMPKLVVKPDSGIKKLSDLKGKKVGTVGSHPGHNDWLLLRQRGLDVDRDDFEFVKVVKGAVTEELAREINSAAGKKKVRSKPLWTWVRDGDVDAALLLAPAHLFAEAAGLEIIDVEPLPMIWYTTISTSLPFAEKNPDLVERFLKGIIEGIHFFKTRPEESIEIIKRKYDKEGPLNEGQARYIHQELAPLLESKLYPSMLAISNVYQEAIREEARAAKTQPLSLWDMHQIRQIDDSGFIAGLYEGNRASDLRKRHNPDFVEEQEALRGAAVAAMKACGHMVGQDCECED